MVAAYERHTAGGSQFVVFVRSRSSGALLSTLRPHHTLPVEVMALLEDTFCDVLSCYPSRLNPVLC